MPRVKMVVSYDGTGFFGWQKQNSGRTVQGVMEEQISRMVKQEIRIIASGRTDSGVHAAGQVVHMDAALERVPQEKLAVAMNSFLPRDIRIRSAVFAPDNFHARFDARLRTYRYFLYGDGCENPFYRNYAWWCPRLPGLQQLNEYARVFVGTHDFTAFSAANEQISHRIRTVSSAVFFRQGPFTVFEISANGFLWRMVRSILGSILDYSAKGISPGRAAEFLAEGERIAAGPSAPPHGLYLQEVRYDEGME